MGNGYGEKTKNRKKTGKKTEKIFWRESLSVYVKVRTFSSNQTYTWLWIQANEKRGVGKDPVSVDTLQVIKKVRANFNASS